MSSKKVDILARLFDTIISHANEDPVSYTHLTLPTSDLV